MKCFYLIKFQQFTHTIKYIMYIIFSLLVFFIKRIYGFKYKINYRPGNKLEN